MLRWICVVLSVLLLSLLLLPMARAMPFAQGGLESTGALSFLWDPGMGKYGFLLSLFGSLLLVLLSLPGSVALAWGIAYQLTRTPAARLRGTVLAILQAANSVPSVVIGIWGIDQLVPFVRTIKGTGYCLITCMVALTVLSLPTTVLLLKQAYREYLVVFEGLERSLGFGWWESTRYFLRTAREQLWQIWLYTFCRLFGETTVVLMLSGNSLVRPDGLFKGFRTLTSSIALEMAYATGRHEHALYALATLSIFCLAAVATLGKRRRAEAAPP